MTFTASHRGGSGSPMVCLHGFTDSWRTWELVLPALERRHDVFAPALAGHAGGPPLDGDVSDAKLVEELERAMDEAGLETTDIVGNSLGGYLALRLAARGRARSVVALAPAGGWAPGDLDDETLEYFATAQKLLEHAAPHADRIASSPDGRRRATAFITTNYEHIPAELIAHQIRAAASCPGAAPLMHFAHRNGWHLDAEQITCPVRVVWGTADRILPWPRAAVRYRDEWLPNADWVVLDGVGHSPQLDVPLEAAELILGFVRS